jgi:hypothetical protein
MEIPLRQTGACRTLPGATPSRLSCRRPPRQRPHIRPARKSQGDSWKRDGGRAEASITHLDPQQTGLDRLLNWRIFLRIRRARRRPAAINPARKPYQIPSGPILKVKAQR